MEQADSANISFILIARHSNRQIFCPELLVNTVIKVHFGVEYLTCRFRLWLRSFLHNRNCRVQRIKHCFGIPEGFNSAVNNGRNGKLVQLLVCHYFLKFFFMNILQNRMQHIIGNKYEIRGIIIFIKIQYLISEELIELGSCPSVLSVCCSKHIVLIIESNVINSARSHQPAQILQLLFLLNSLGYIENDGVSVSVALCDIVAVIVQFFKEVFLFMKWESAHRMSCSVGERTRGHSEFQSPCNLFGILIKELIEVPYSDSGYCIGVCAFQAL